LLAVLLLGACIGCARTPVEELAAGPPPVLGSGGMTSQAPLGLTSTATPRPLATSFGVVTAEARETAEPDESTRSMADPAATPAPSPYISEGEAGHIKGRVVGTSGLPIAGICVMTWEPVAQQSPAGEFGDYLTDATGRFEIVTPPNRVWLRVEGGCGPGAGSYENITFFRDASGDPVLIDVRTSGASGIEVVLRPKGTLRGHVTGPLEVPLAGVCVTARDVRHDNDGAWKDEDSDVTDVLGAFELKLDEASYDVFFEACELPSELGTYRPEYYEDKTSEQDATPVRVTWGQTTQISATLEVA
jgi:hypothetical protein